MQFLQIFEKRIDIFSVGWYYHMRAIQQAEVSELADEQD